MDGQTDRQTQTHIFGGYFTLNIFSLQMLKARRYCNKLVALKKEMISLHEKSVKLKVSVQL